jgi:hypothetical protein
LARRYGVSVLHGDKYAPGFVNELVRAHGLSFEPLELDRSRLYLELLPAVNSQRVLLLDVPELLREFRMLQRRRGTIGLDRVNHPVGLHDDRANSSAGALVLALHVLSSSDGLGFLAYANEQVHGARAGVMFRTHDECLANVTAGKQHLSFTDMGVCKTCGQHVQPRGSDVEPDEPNLWLEMIRGQR